METALYNLLDLQLAYISSLLDITLRIVFDIAWFGLVCIIFYTGVGSSFCFLLPVYLQYYFF